MGPRISIDVSNDSRPFAFAAHQLKPRARRDRRAGFSASRRSCAAFEHRRSCALLRSPKGSLARFRFARRAWPVSIRPAIMRTSGEIDAYPGNAGIWEVTRKAIDPDDDPEASEEVAALFGEGSAFHRKHGFYIDGVDENTARLPRDWATVQPVDRTSQAMLKVFIRSAL
jgi:hypothetical protein